MSKSGDSVKARGKTLRLVCFPNTLADFDRSQVLDDLESMGVAEVLVCCSIYTGYRLVMPRNPRRQIYALEEGKLYFPPDPACYRGLRLQPEFSADFADGDLLTGFVADARGRGIRVGAWVPFFANGRLAKADPDCAVENLYGARDRLYLCCNHPEVRRHAWAMTEDLVTHYDLSGVMIDKIPQTVLELNAFNGRIDPVLRLAGTFCFCAHCRREAAQVGLDLEAVRRRALELAESSRRVPPWVVQALCDELQGDTEIPLLLLDEPLLYEALRFRIQTVAELLRETGQRIRELRPGLEHSACLVPPVKIGHDAASPRAWLGAQSYRAFAPAVHTLHGVVHWSPDVVAYDTRRAADAVQGRCELCIHLPAYGAVRPEHIPALADSARAGGADSLAFFSYELMAGELVAAIARWAGANS